MGPNREESKERLLEAGGRLLQVPLVQNGRIIEEGWTPEATWIAQDRHRKSRNELPYQAWRLSDGEPGIRTRYYGPETPIEDYV